MVYLVNKNRCWQKRKNRKQIKYKYRESKERDLEKNDKGREDKERKRKTEYINNDRVREKLDLGDKTVFSVAIF